MADISDVEAALVTVATAALYPAGTGSPSAVTAACKAYRGWPNKSQLDADLKAGIVNVSVYAMPGTTRNSTRYSLEWQVFQPAVTTLIATVSGNQITISGTGGARQLVGIKVDGVPCVYQTTSNDTSDTVATAIAALVSGATAVGTVITVPGDSSIVARVQGFAVVRQELRRQWQRIMLSCWCSSPSQRDAVAKTVDAALAVFDGGFIPLPDGTGGRLMYRTTSSNDVPSKDALWRRDLIYDIEYATVSLASAPPIIWPEILLTSSDGGTPSDTYV